MAYWETILLDGGVALARYRNAPMNYFCAEAAAELGRLIEAFSSPDVRAVVITGAIPGKFITHYSVEEIAALGADRAQLERIGTALSDGYHALLASLRALPKPVIAAINGDCMGGGFELALWCDIRVMSQGDYRIGLPEIHMGIMPGGSGTQMLTRLVGSARALELILRGLVLTPARALELGLVHELADDAAARGLAIAAQLAALNPTSLAAIKRAVHAFADAALRQGLKEEAVGFLEVMRSPAALPTMTEYLAVPAEKRRDWLEAKGPA